MKKILLFLVLIVTNQTFAKNNSMVFYCVTGNGDYEYKVDVKNGLRVALNNEGDTQVVLDDNVFPDTSTVRNEHDKYNFYNLCINKLPSEKQRTFTSNLDTIYFDLNKYSLSPKAKDIINKVLRNIVGKNNLIVIEGHTDKVGDKKYNASLALKRARSVANYMIKVGYKQNLLKVVAVGESSPRFSNSLTVGRAKNRRVELILSK